MRMSFTFRNMESSEAFKNYATEKLVRLEKYLQEAAHCEVTASMNRHLQRVDISLTSGAHEYTSHHESEDMYASVDLAFDKIDGQIRRSKSAETHKRRSSEGISAVFNGKGK